MVSFIVKKFKKMAKRDQLDWDVIRRRIDGQSTAEEEQQLREWADKDERRQKFVLFAEKYYASEELPLLGEEQVDRAWDHFQTIQRQHRKSLRYAVIRWSVAALVLVALGSGWWLYAGIGRMTEKFPVAETILPGSSKACLILSNGEMVDLNAAVQQRLTDQQASISLDSTGAISYEQTGHSWEVVYNTLQIPRGGEYCLTLCDGTRVWLNAKTNLTYPVVFTGKERRVKLCGEAYFEVAHREKQPFIVETDKMEVKVLGTSFNVSSYEDEPEILTTLVSGKVQIQKTGYPEKELRPSEQAVWVRETGKMAVREVNTSVYTQWRNGKFVYRDNDLEMILRSLSRWYDLEYEFLQPELKTEKFYGVISRYADIRDLLEQFEKTGKVHFVYAGKKVIVKK